MFPDEAEGTVGLAIITERRAALMVVEDPRVRIIGAADVINDAVCCGRNQFGCAAAHDRRVRMEPGQDDGGQQFVGMEAATMGDEMGDGHAGRTFAAGMLIKPSR